MKRIPLELAESSSRIVKCGAGPIELSSFTPAP